MADPDSTPDTGAVSPVRYGTDAFDRALQALHSGEDEPSTARILFHGGTRETRQQALAALTRHTTANLHQFRVPSLLNEQRMQTQNALRKAFDHAAEESALLYFDAADALFTHSHVDTPDDDAERAVPSTVEYFFDRVLAYGNAVVIALQTQRHADWAEEHVHLVVRFE
ncbi:SpoVK/Ycf46/Vps4 family AAA+-type ATPase [Salinibacter ruber]|uniref:AAA family ATPase n=1 Tax=Salinibacter ruber TaxID=146919 RepID=UPI000E582FA4|nr:AAA family ATPase [Salinibacter ruber]MCS3628853.1 SpoVK/Ycf46/Vps4 family AAA+-type ATPase [Salinibacter ruber]MCS3827181.1 SpoVK/Ycf46/Vps4 family AAA+-type ATPase [Salinibacter ruber]MCS4145762.1 SpoVK/Ycf46/Vps4 family AAA+-type ATPase [Salinibacter ruber]MCS4193902.1 SpoVK/Ycf46/Vps4 family AAA+-type ATPase [Salinibacter ruber]MCS4200752.1 SpoVK/Ycf46/Vps4 family AAA+-type ATPase [Salinibacter ruber]